MDVNLTDAQAKDGDSTVGKHEPSGTVYDTRSGGESSAETNVMGRNEYSGVVAKRVADTQVRGKDFNVRMYSTGKFNRPIVEGMVDMNGTPIDPALVRVALGYTEYHRQYGHPNPDKDKLFQFYEATMPDDEIMELDDETFELIGEKSNQLIEAFQAGDQEESERLTKELFEDPYTMVKYHNQMNRNLVESDKILPKGLAGAAILAESLKFGSDQGSQEDNSGVRLSRPMPTYTMLEKFGKSFEAFAPTIRIAQMETQQTLRLAQRDSPELSDAAIMDGIEIPHFRKMIIEERANYGSDAAKALAQQIKKDTEFRTLEENMSWYASMGYALPAYLFDPTAVAMGSFAGGIAARIGAGTLAKAGVGAGTRAAIGTAQWTVGGAIDAALVDAPRLFADQTYGSEEYLTDVIVGTALAGGVGAAVAGWRYKGDQKIAAKKAIEDIETAKNTSQMLEYLEQKDALEISRQETELNDLTAEMDELRRTKEQAVAAKAVIQQKSAEATDRVTTNEVEGYDAVTQSEVDSLDKISNKSEAELADIEKKSDEAIARLEKQHQQRMDDLARRKEAIARDLSGPQGQRLTGNIAFHFKKHAPNFSKVAARIHKMHQEKNKSPEMIELLGKVTEDLAEIARTYPNGALPPQVEKNMKYYYDGLDEAGYEHIIGGREVDATKVRNWTHHVTSLDIWGDTNPVGSMSGRDFLVKWGVADGDIGSASADIKGAVEEAWVDDPEQMKRLLMDNQFSNANNHAESESGAFLDDIIKIVNEQYGKGDPELDAELEKMLFAIDARMQGKTRGDWEQVTPSLVEDINPTTFEDFNNLLQQEYNSNYIRANKELRARMAAAMKQTRNVQELAKKLEEAGHDPVAVINKHFDVKQHEDLISDINQARHDDNVRIEPAEGAQKKYVASNQKIGDRLDRNFGELLAMARKDGVEIYSAQYKELYDKIDDADMAEEVLESYEAYWEDIVEGGEIPDNLDPVLEAALEARLNSHNRHNRLDREAKREEGARATRVAQINKKIRDAKSMVRKYHWGKLKNPFRMEAFEEWTTELDNLLSNKLDLDLDAEFQRIEQIERDIDAELDVTYKAILRNDYAANGADSFMGKAIEIAKHKSLRQWTDMEGNAKYSKAFWEYKDKKTVRTNSEVAKYSSDKVGKVDAGEHFDRDIAQTDNGSPYDNPEYDSESTSNKGKNYGKQVHEFDASGSDFLPRSRVVASGSVGDRSLSRTDALKGAHNFLRGKVIPKLHNAVQESATRAAMTAGKKAEAKARIDRAWRDKSPQEFKDDFIFGGNAIEFEYASKKYNDWVEEQYAIKKNEYDAKLEARKAEIEEARAKAKDASKAKAKADSEAAVAKHEAKGQEITDTTTKNLQKVADWEATKLADLEERQLAAEKELEAKEKELEARERDLAKLQENEPEAPVKLDDASLDKVLDHADGKVPDSEVAPIKEAMHTAEKNVRTEKSEEIDELIEDFVETKDKVGSAVRDNESWISRILGTGTRSIGEQLFKSKLPSLRLVGTLFTELSYGYSGLAARMKTAATVASVNYHRTMARFAPHFDEAFDEWIVEQGSSAFAGKTDKFTPEAASKIKKQFNDQFASYVNDKRLGRTPKESAAMDKLFKHWIEGMDHVHDMQVKAGVKGFTPKNKRKNYMPQVWKKGAITKYVADNGYDALVDLLLKGMDEPDLAGARNIADHITQQMDEADMYVPTTDARAKARANLDWAAADKNGVTIMDLLDTDIPIVYNKYAKRASGQAAISDITGGVLNSPDSIEAYRERIKTEAAAVGEDVDEALDLFNQIIAELHGRPPKGDTPEWLRAIKESTVLNFMGKLGTAQLAESGIGLAKSLRSGDMMGLKAAFKANPELAGELAHFTGLSDEMHRFQTYSNYLDAEEVEKIGTVRQVMGMAADIATGGERVRSTAQRALGALSGFNSVRAAQHRMVQVSTAVEIMKNLRGDPSSISAERLLDLGIDKAVGSQILRELNTHANFDMQGNLVRLNLEKWDENVSNELAYALERGAAQDVQRTLVGEKPAYLNNPYIAAIAQFKEFSIVAQSKALRRGLNFADAEAATGIILNIVTANIARVGALSAVGGIAALTSEDEFNFDEIVRKANTKNYISAVGVGSDLFSLANWAHSGNKELTGHNMWRMAETIPALSLAGNYYEMRDPSVERAIAIMPLHTTHLVEALAPTAEETLQDLNYRK